MTPGGAAADDALDRLWGDFFRLRASAASGEGTAVLAGLRALHAAAGATGSDHVPVFRAEVRGEIARIKGGARAAR